MSSSRGSRRYCGAAASSARTRCCASATSRSTRPPGRWSAAGSAIELTPKEYGLLRYLMENAGTVLSRAQILNNNWGYGFDPGTKVVDVYVRYLRRKIDEGEPVALIRTVRGVGYRVGERSRRSEAGKEQILRVLNRDRCVSVARPFSELPPRLCRGAAREHPVPVRPFRDCQVGVGCGGPPRQARGVCAGIVEIFSHPFTGGRV